MCTAIGPGATCPCSCKTCPSGGSIAIIERPFPNDPGAALSGIFVVENHGATLATLMNAFITGFNWDVSFDSIDPDSLSVGDFDFAVEATSMLNSVSATFDLCYEVDVQSVEITFRAEGTCQ